MDHTTPVSVVQVIGNVEVGGAERHVIDLVQGLAALGVRLHMVCPRPGPLSETLIALGIRVRFLEIVRPRPGDEYALDWAAVKELSAWFQRWHPDLVHSHLYPAHLHASLAAAIAGVPAVLQTAHTLVVRPGEAAIERLTRSRTIATSHAVAAGLMKAGLSGQRMKVIHNGVGDEHLCLDPEAVCRVRSELALSDGPVVGTVARLSPEKGVDVLLAALPEILTCFPSLTTLIVGDGSETRRLRELAAGHGDVRFLGTRGDVAAVNRLFDVFVLPSRQEACPMALLEAMAAERAVVATCVGGSPELVDNGIDGVLVPPEEPAVLSAAIVGLLRRPAQRQALGCAAHEKIARSFTRDQMVSQTYAYYQRILAE